MNKRRVKCISQELGLHPVEVDVTGDNTTRIGGLREQTSLMRESDQEGSTVV
jgi:hypothetical protein